MKLILDFETDSPVKIRKAGTHKYVRDPRTRVLCLSITDFDTREQRMWWPGDPVPPEFSEPAIVLEAHNAAFERAVIRHVSDCAPFPVEMLNIKRWRCSMAACAYRSLPQRLEDVAVVLHLEHQKGSMPRPPWTWEKLADTYAYCLLDGRVQCELSHRIGELPPEEQRVWELDQEINERGVWIDQELCRAAIEIEWQVRSRLNANLLKITGGAVETSDQRTRILAWIGTRLPFPLADLTEETVAAWVNAKDVPSEVRRVLEIRQALAKSSAKKYKAALDCVCDDGRARGLLAYHGTTTGRWAGRLLQPQNFARPTPGREIETLVSAIKSRDAEFIAMVCGDVFQVFKDAVRGIIVTAPGHKLVVGDFSSIESVVNACISREDWKIEAYRTGADMYCLFASKALGREILKKIAKDPTHSDYAEHSAARQTVGKLGELAFGYEGGIGAWRKFDATDAYDDETVDDFKKVWREQHPQVVRLWRRLNECALRAVLDPTQSFGYNGCTFAMSGERLGCTLPSGRTLWYNEPRIIERLMPWRDRNGNDVWRPAVVVKAWKDGRWRDLDLFGGLLTENVVSGTSRDLMVGAMFRLNPVAPVVLTCHDEIVCEVPIDSLFGKVDIDRIMAVGETWAPRWPITVEAWEGPRYRKA